MTNLQWKTYWHWTWQNLTPSVWSKLRAGHYIRSYTEHRIVIALIAPAAGALFVRFKMITVKNLYCICIILFCICICIIKKCLRLWIQDISIFSNFFHINKHLVGCFPNLNETILNPNVSQILTQKVMPGHILESGLIKSMVRKYSNLYFKD